MSLELREQEAIAVAISVAAGCRPCTAYHLKAAARAGATAEEIAEAVASAAGVRRNALNLMVALAGDDAPQDSSSGSGSATTRRQELAAIGAAVAVNCVVNLEKHLAAAAGQGISEEDTASVIALARMIKGKAAEHLDAAVERQVENVPVACCG